MIKVERNGLQLLQFNNIENKGCTHFSTTTHGGVSKGNYSSLNFGFSSGDKAQNVIENKRILCQELCISPNSFFKPHQTHGNNILLVDDAFLNLDKETQTQKLDGVDALITNIPKVCISVGTADCVPILIYDPKKKVIASIHAGWRGTVARIGALTVQKLVSEFASQPQDLLVGIGPSICAKHFEVGDEVGEAFTQVGYKLEEIAYQHIETKKLHIDLWKANQIQLEKVGIPKQNIEIAELCTFSNPKDFFSARRQTIHSGRMITGGYIHE